MKLTEDRVRAIVQEELRLQQEPKLISERELGALIGVSMSTLLRWRRIGRIPVKAMIGASPRYDSAAVIAAIEGAPPIVHKPKRGPR